MNQPSTILSYFEVDLRNHFLPTKKINQGETKCCSVQEQSRVLNFLECSQFFLLTLMALNYSQSRTRSHFCSLFFHVMIYIAFFSFLCCLKPLCFCYTLLVEVAWAKSTFCVFGVSSPDRSRWFLHVSTGVGVYRTTRLP